MAAEPIGVCACVRVCVWVGRGVYGWVGVGRRVCVQFVVSDPSPESSVCVRVRKYACAHYHIICLTSGEGWEGCVSHVHAHGHTYTHTHAQTHVHGGLELFVRHIRELGDAVDLCGV